MKVVKFEDLEIWKNALVATKLIYDFTSQKEFSKDFELKNQIRRSVISISSNIVEGFEKIIIMNSTGILRSPKALQEKSGTSCI